MPHNRKEITPVLTLGEFDGGGAFISFGEYIDLLGLKNADISIHFDNDNSFETVERLRHQLKDAGFRLVINLQ